MGIIPLLFFAASAYTVTEDGFPMRRSCEPSGDVVAELRRGEPVEVRFSMTSEYGPCYKVSAERGGKAVEGWVPAKALTGLETFERARLAAQSLDSPQVVRQDIDAVRRVDRGGKAGSLALAGLAAYQKDEVRAAMDLWQQSLALTPNPSVERMLDRARRELEHDKSTAQLFGARFLLRYDPQSVTADQARPIVVLLDSEFARVAEAVGCRAGDRITAILQTREQYLQSTGAAEWSGGRYDGRIRVALMEQQPGPATRQAFAHEIVHACLAQTGDWPGWLHEGLAQKLSGEVMSPAERSAVLQMARSGQLPPLANLTQTFSRMNANNAAIAYTVAHAAVEQLYQAYGPEGVRSLLQSPERLSQVTAEVDRRLRQ